MRKLFAMLALCAWAAALAGCEGSEPGYTDESTAAYEPTADGEPPADDESTTATTDDARGADESLAGSGIYTDDGLYLGTYYDVYLSIDFFSEESNTLRLDDSGRIIEDERIAEPVTDILTGQTAYYQVQKLVRPEGESSEDFYGRSSYSEYYYYALYDTEGHMVRDYENRNYSCAMNGYVLCGKPTEWWYGDSDRMCCLIDPYSGDIILSGITDLLAINAECAAVIGGDDGNTLLGIIDADCNELYGFPMDCVYYDCQTAHERLFATASGPDGQTDYMFDGDMNLIYKTEPGENINPDFYAFRGEFARANANDNYSYVIDPYDGRTLWRALDFIYFDGEVAINGGEQLIDVSKVDENYDGTPLTQVYTYIQPSTQYSRGVWANVDTSDIFFYAYCEDALYVIGRDGSILAQAEVPGICGIQSMGDYVSAYLDTGTEVVYNKELNLISLPGDYTSLQPVCEFWGYGPEDTFILFSLNGAGQSRVSLIREDGTYIVKDAKELMQTNSDEIFIAYKGSYIGFMDFEGNWLTKYDIYSHGGADND